MAAAGFGEIDEDEQVIELDPSPEIDALAPSEICEGFTADLRKCELVAKGGGRGRRRPSR